MPNHKVFLFTDSPVAKVKVTRGGLTTKGREKLENHSTQAGDFQFSCLYKLEARSFALSPDSAPLIADMATVIDVSWDLILRVGKGRGPLRHGRELGMDEGQSWEVKGWGCWKGIWKGRRGALLLTECEESFHEENQVTWLLSSLALRPCTGHT